jgi:hypothetical protein
MGSECKNSHSSCRTLTLVKSLAHGAATSFPLSQRLGSSSFAQFRRNKHKHEETLEIVRMCNLPPITSEFELRGRHLSAPPPFERKSEVQGHLTTGTTTGQSVWMKHQVGIAMNVAMGPPVEDPSADQDLPSAVPAYCRFSHIYRWLPFLLTVPMSLPMSKASIATHHRSRFPRER